MMRFSEADNGKTVEVPIGQEIEVALTENPTTGFRWRMAQAGEPVCAYENDSFDPGMAAPGMAGSHAWRFKVVAAGTSSIELDHRRPWEDGSDGGAAYALRLVVKA